MFYGRVAQLVRARSLYLRGPWFEPRHAHHSMTFLLIGIFLLIASWQLRKKFIKSHNHGGIHGMNSILIAALILIIFYGIIDRMVIL